MKDLTNIFDNYRHEVADYMNKIKEEAYKQGKQEQCDKCDYFVSVEEAYQQGRADALDEAINIALGNYHTKISAYELEKLKEQKNE